MCVYLRNIPLNSWSRITFKNALLQGGKMFLNALDSGFIILDQGVELLTFHTRYVKRLFRHKQLHHL